jgi:hypothetical protein
MLSMWKVRHPESFNQGAEHTHREFRKLAFRFTLILLAELLLAKFVRIHRYTLPIDNTSIHASHVISPLSIAIDIDTKFICRCYICLSILDSTSMALMRLCTSPITSIADGVRVNTCNTIDHLQCAW